MFMDNYLCFIDITCATNDILISSMVAKTNAESSGGDICYICIATKHDNDTRSEIGLKWSPKKL